MPKKGNDGAMTLVNGMIAIEQIAVKQGEGLTVGELARLMKISEKRAKTLITNLHKGRILVRYDARSETSTRPIYRYVIDADFYSHCVKIVDAAKPLFREFA